MPIDPEITDVAERFRLAMLSQFDSSPRIQRLRIVFGDALQEWETFLHDVFDAWRFPDAIGRQLEIWGEKVGEQRGEFTDDGEFRRVIQARAIANRSKWGNTETILAIVRLITEADVITVKQQGRLYFYLVYEVSSPLPQRLRDALVRILGPAVMHAVGVDIVEAETGAAFGYSGGTGLAYNVGKYATLVGSL